MPALPDSDRAARRPRPILTLTVAAVLLGGLLQGTPPAEAAPDAPPAAPSRIRRVTVYEDRALVTRTAGARLPAGVSELRIEHLPASMDRDSVTIRTGDARVLGIDVRNVHVTEAPGATLREAEAALRSAQRGLREADVRLATVTARHSFVYGLRADPGEGDDAEKTGTPDVEALGRLLAFMDEELQALAGKLVEAEENRRKAVEAVNAAQRRVNEVRGGASRTEVEVLVTLEADAAGEADLMVQYMVGNARWVPAYDLRVSGDFDGAQLGLTGVVVQRTGEDWEGVELELTTAQPATGAAPPEFPRWQVGRPQPPPAPSAAEGAPAAAAEPAMRRRLGRLEEQSRKSSKGGADARARRDQTFEAAVRRSGVVVAFGARTPETIRSDGQPARVGLARWDLAPDFRWVTHPAVMDKVFVTAKVTNTTGSPLPGGDARVFLGPDFVGRMPLADWGIDKETVLGLGVDREVEVEREALDTSSATEGLFSKDTVQSRRFRVMVTNHRDLPVQVVVRETIPVSTDEEIEVEVTETSQETATLPEREAETNEARGVLEWHFDLGPSEQHTLRYTFEVRHPKELRITGMDR